MTDVYEAMKEATRRQADAENAVSRARQAVESTENKFREALPVGRNQPCCVAITPSGKVVVHVWVDAARNPNQLHVVEPGYFTEDALPRKKFAHEQLGAGES